VKRAWIVDDDTGMIEAVGLLLSLIDFETQGYQDARQAAEALQTGQLPDLVVLDIHMPEVNGLDLLEYIRRNPDWERLPVIMLSSETSIELMERSLQLGADAYLVKPASLDELEQAIKRGRMNTG